MQKAGIEAISFYIPKLYLTIKELAIKREIEPAKLEKGLGLKQMSLNDTNEDTATLAANALLKLITDFNINPTEIDRIYLGTESALDASKPTAIYATQMVEEQLADKYGERCFKYTDILDMVFACIGAVDALQSTLDFIRVNPTKKAIVIAADYAKYELASSGEYTQGSGAVAMLISSDPKLLSFENEYGVSTESVFDFFKPKRRINTDTSLKKAISTENKEIDILLDEPVFDGQYSNECYKNRIRDAYYRLKEIKNTKETLFDNWRFLVFHLPYAFQGKRVFTDLFSRENEDFITETIGKKDIAELDNNDIKTISKTPEYLSLVEKKITPTQTASSAVGNLYTASIFVALLSALENAFINKEDLSGQKIGFFAYGSGSKSKVFEATVSPEWKSVIEKQQLFKQLESRTEIPFSVYEEIHTKSREQPYDDSIDKFILTHIEKANPLLVGARYYTYKK
jgi:hydroxymethylglutaryl-CoA synthase